MDRKRIARWLGPLILCAVSSTPQMPHLHAGGPGSFSVGEDQGLLEHRIYTGPSFREVVTPFPVEFVEQASQAADKIEWAITVVDAQTGAPIERVSVDSTLTMVCGTGYIPEFVLAEGQPGECILTDSEGTVRIHGDLEPTDGVRVWTRVARSANYVGSYHSAELRLPPGRPGFQGQLTISLVRDGLEHSRVSVVDGETGQPVPGAQVSAVLAFERNWRKNRIPLEEVIRVPLATTDQDGACEISHNPVTSCWLTAEAPGYGPRWLWKPGDDHWMEPDRKIPSELWPVSIELWRDGTLSGWIDAGPEYDAQPLRLVMAWDANELRQSGVRVQPFQFVRTLEVQSRKPFQVQGLPSHVPLHLRVETNDLLHTNTQPLRLDPGGTRSWEWSVDKGITLSLAVREGAPAFYEASQIELYCLPEGRLGWMQFSAAIAQVAPLFATMEQAILPADRNTKSITWRGLDPGRYRLRFYHPGSEEVGYRAFGLDLTEDRRITVGDEVPLTVQLPFGQLSEETSLKFWSSSGYQELTTNPDAVGCEYRDDRITVWVPPAEYRLVLGTKSRTRFGIQAYREVSILEPTTWNVEHLDEGPFFPLAFHWEGAQRQNAEPLPDGPAFVGQVLRHGIPVAPVFRHRSLPLSSRLQLPAGSYEFRDVKGQSTRFDLSSQSANRVDVPNPGR